MPEHAQRLSACRPIQLLEVRPREASEGRLWPVQSIVEMCTAMVRQLSRLYGVWEMGMRTTAVAAALSALMLSGCATMFRGTTQQVSINTDPPGATVTTSTGQSCTSPCLFEAQRKNTLQVTIEKDGCNTYTSAMIPTLAGLGLCWAA